MDNNIKQSLEQAYLKDLESAKHLGGCLGYAAGIILGTILCIILSCFCA